jgi:hypothetical protein
MSSLAHRTLISFIETDNLPGLKSFLDTRQQQVDDRDEVFFADRKNEKKQTLYLFNIS